MITVTLYYRQDCPHCDSTLEMLNELAEMVPHRLVKIDIDSDQDLTAMYNSAVPVIQVGPYHLKKKFTRMELEVVLRSARDRAARLEEDGGGKYQARLDRAGKVSGADRFSYWLSKHYMLAFNLLVAIFLGLTFLAPVFMHWGWELPAKVIYTAYRPMCHQFSFRSWFLFGDHPYYPRPLAHVQGAMTYDELAAMIPDRMITVDGMQAYEAFSLSSFPEKLIPPEEAGWELSARRFIGVHNDEIHTGYKVAFCQRDVAIWGGILVFGLIFSVLRTRIRALPWYLWVALGIVPIGLDGGTQLLAFLSGILPEWLVIRESTPFLRTLTGGLFGLMTAWMFYPLVEQTMADTRRFLLRKFTAIEQAQAGMDTKKD